jgi:hypothetical protein
MRREWSDPIGDCFCFGVQEDNIGELTKKANARKVELLHCATVPDALLQLAGLEVLSCKKCSYSSTFGFQKLTSLPELELVFCDKLTDVQHLRNLPNLRHLLLEVCTVM